MEVVPPPEVVQWVLANTGRHGSRWLDGLERRVRRSLETWRLQPVRPLRGGLTSYVLECRDADGRPCVLKVSGAPDLAAKETRALRFWRGSRSVVRLLACEDDEVFLLERVFPGTPLRELPDDTSTARRIARLLDALHGVGSPAEVDRLPLLDERIHLRLALIRRALPARRASALEALALGLLETSGRRAPLHGDLGQGNVLDGGAGLVAIDPRGYAGERAYDLAVWAQKRGVERALVRAQTIARLCGVDRERVHAWTRVRLASHAAHLLAGNREHEEARAALELAYQGRRSLPGRPPARQRPRRPAEDRPAKT